MPTPKLTPLLRMKLGLANLAEAVEVRAIRHARGNCTAKNLADMKRDINEGLKEVCLAVEEMEQDINRRFGLMQDEINTLKEKVFPG